MAALERAKRAVRDGAAMLDIGGESTRPGAQRVPAAEQIERVVPIIEAVRGCENADVAGIPISVDTTLAEVAHAALQSGADAVNDVSGATEDADLLGVVAEFGAGLVLMHRAAPPPADKYADEYQGEPVFAGGVVAAVRSHLAQRAEAARAAGVNTEGLVIDPGLGFGKSVRQNVQLLASVLELASLGMPVYIGASRKRFIGRVSITGESEPGDRLAGSIAATILAAQQGAPLHRVHDVAEHVQALATLQAWQEARGGTRNAESGS